MNFPTLFCIPVLEIDGWEEAQEAFVYRGPVHLHSKLFYCCHCGKTIGWMHLYTREAREGAAPERRPYLSLPLICEDCNGIPSLSHLHSYLYQPRSVLTGLKAVAREIDLTMKERTHGRADSRKQTAD